MKISTKLKLITYVPFLIAIILIGVLVYSAIDMRSIQNNGNRVRDIRSSIREINNLVFTYILFQGDRPKQQFQAEYQVLTTQLSEFSVRNADQQQLLDSIRKDSLATNDYFNQLVSNYENNSSSGSIQISDAQNQLVSLLLQRTYEADTSAAQLRADVDSGLNGAEIRTFILILVVLTLVSILLTIVLNRTRRGISSALYSLHQGTSIIGSGNLDYKILDENPDELGDLSRSFNKMTLDLKQVTAGKKELEREISERQKTEENLRHRSAELEVSNKELESFSYSVSHDLRAPLRSLEGFSSALVEDYTDKLDAQGIQYLKYIQESSELMARLIDDMLRLSRVTRSEMNYETVNLSDLAEGILAQLAGVEPQRQVKVTIARDIMTKGDLNLLRLMLENLLGNAWKFSSKQNQAQIEVGTLELEGKQTYFVRDNGVGFDMAYVDKLFQPFQRLHKNSEFAGTGIGLATVQRIIRRHGGRIWVESKLGEGTTFYFTLS